MDLCGCAGVATAGGSEAWLRRRSVLPSSLLWHFGRYGWGAACRVVGLARRHDLHYVTIPISVPATPTVLLIAT